LSSRVGPQFVAGWPVIWPLLAVSAASLLLRLTSLDLAVSALFYDPVRHAWPWFYSPVCTGFYRGGTYPAFGLALIGLGMGTCGLLSPRRRERCLRAGTFLWVAFVVGPGLIVNCGFKEAWGRPRPHQVEQFGGPHRFVPVGTPSLQQPQNSSFPSGHAAVAFFLIAPAFLVDRQRPRLARILLTAGLAFGAAMSAVRVVQGGHFVSDVLWSAAIVYLTCVACARLLLHPRCRPDSMPVSGRVRSWSVVVQH
jgi:membrane-associated PAP2 superfamily phosphatase